MTAGAIVAAVLGSGALFTFVQFLINRHDSRNDRTKQLTESVDALRADFTREIAEVQEELTWLKDENRLQNATQARIRILRFDEELRRGVEHSLEHFAAISEDLSTYEDYYREHPDLKNGLGKLAVAHIREVYAKLSTENRLK